MGTSERWQIPHVLDAVVDVQPRSVLDVGAGYGKFGVLVREYAPIERVDGLDVGPPRYAGYDHFWIGDARELDTVLPEDAPVYDLALFLEVIEHLDKKDAFRVLDALTRRARKVLVTTPLGFRRQQFDELPYETHRSGWYPWEFGGRYRVHAVRIYPGARSRLLRLPRLWQIMVLLSSRDPR
ncbi:MAG: class I SAM-dependent methyltransferase [Candidatus Eisenbacteria bacterium]